MKYTKNHNVVLETLETRRLLSAEHGLSATYFNGIAFDVPIASRVDATVNFYWSNDAPTAGVSQDRFSVRWVGQVEARYSESYEFITRTDEGVRLWIDGKLIIDAWDRHGLRTDSGKITLEAGKRYDIRMEYYDFSSRAVARLMWQSASQALEDVPASQLYAQTSFTPTVPKTGQIIQAEDFDLGMRDVAYGDANAGNTGKVYRDSDVDLQPTTDVGGGFNIGWGRAGEWLEYTIDVPTSGKYDLDFRIAALGAGGLFHAEVDGVNVTGALAMPNTGGWQNWQTVTHQGITLAAGRHVLRVSQDQTGSGGWVGNFNWLRLREAAATPEVAVRHALTSITTGQTTPIDFGSVEAGDSGHSLTFTVTNEGDGLLTLGTPQLPDGFSLAEALAGSLAPGESDTFTVRLDATTPGSKAGSIVITTNDADESVFTFAVAGTVTFPTGGTPLISEDFTNGAVNFAVIDGAWGIIDGLYRVTADNNASTTHLNSRAIHQTALAGDFVLTVDVRALAAAAPWANAAVIFGYQDPSNYYFFSSNQSNDAGTNGIFKVVNGVSTELVDIPATITPDVTYQLRLERVGNEIKAYRGTALVATAVDGTFTSGHVGLASRQFQAAFDNFVVTGTAVVPPSEPPAAPSSLAASATSSSSINLAWTDNATTESGFRVQRSTDGSVWQEIATLGANVTQYAATGLTAATNYFFRVLAVNAAGSSAFSNTASATTQAAPTTPAKPDATNTGPNNPAALLGLAVRPPTATGATITAPGTYSGFDFTGSITVAADNVVLENFVLRNGEINVNGRSNVTIRNFRILGGSSGGTGTAIRADTAVGNILIEHGEITNANSGAVIYGRNLTTRYLYIHDTAGDVYRPVEGNVTIEYCYVTRIGVPNDTNKHADGIQSWGLNGLVMRYNNFDVGTGPGVNSAVNVDTNSNMIIEYNWFNGGGICVGVGSVENGNNIMRHNKWGRGFAFGAVYPPNATAKAYILWQDNVYEDNGQPVPW